jgi:hypothetical protein
LKGVAVNVIGVPGQNEPAGVALIRTDADRIGFTVIMITLLLAVAGIAQPSEDVSTTLTRSPLLRVAVAKDGELKPTLAPLTFHWYVGDAPPSVLVAVKITLSSAHIGPPGLTVILTVGAEGAVTVIGI